MTSIIYVGMDVHTTNYTLCCYSTPHSSKVFNFATDVGSKYLKYGRTIHNFLYAYVSTVKQS